MTATIAHLATLLEIGVEKGRLVIKGREPAKKSFWRLYGSSLDMYGRGLSPKATTLDDLAIFLLNPPPGVSIIQPLEHKIKTEGPIPERATR